MHCLAAQLVGTGRDAVVMGVSLDVVPRVGAAAGDAADVVVVFDVLRMTTTATVLVAAGLRSLWVVADVEAARSEAAARGALLFGERGGVAVPGFDGGNSPLEVRAERVAGRDAVLCTTNGSRAVASAGPVPVLLGAVVNAAAVARRLASLAPARVRLVCAGTEGRVSNEDVAGAACVLAALVGIGVALDLDDAAVLAVRAGSGADGVEALVRRAAHAHTLARLGFADDVAFAARRDVFDVVPERGPATDTAFVAGPLAHDGG
jgi:2-phosphosulfolactate phosphatase